MVNNNCGWLDQGGKENDRRAWGNGEGPGHRGSCMHSECGFYSRSSVEPLEGLKPWVLIKEETRVQDARRGP